MKLITTLIDAGAAMLVVYVAAWLFLTLRDQCRRQNPINTAERSACTSGAAAVSLAFAILALVAIFN